MNSGLYEELVRKLVSRLSDHTSLQGGDVVGGRANRITGGSSYRHQARRPRSARSPSTSRRNAAVCLVPRSRSLPTTSSRRRRCKPCSTTSGGCAHYCADDLSRCFKPRLAAGAFFFQAEFDSVGVLFPRVRRCRVSVVGCRVSPPRHRYWQVHQYSMRPCGLQPLQPQPLHARTLTHQSPVFAGMFCLHSVTSPSVMV